MARVVGGEAGQPGAGEERDAHPFVPLDLGDAGPDHVHHRDGLGDRAAAGVGVGAGEHQQALAVAPHAGGEVVEPEERLQLVRVLLAVLQALDQGELAVDQGEGAQRELDERGGDGGMQGAEPGGERVLLLGEGDAFPGQRGLPAAQSVAFGGRGAALVGLGTGAFRLLGGDALAQRAEFGGEPLDRPGDGGELVAAGDRRGPGGLGGVAAEAGQRADDRAGGLDADAEAQQRAQAHEGAADLQGGDVVVAQRGEAGGVGGGQRGGHRAHAVGPGAERAVDDGRGQTAVRGGEGGAGGEPSQVAVGGADVGAGDGLVVLGAGGGGGGGGEVVEGRLLAQPGDAGRADERSGVAGGVQGGGQQALLGGVLGDGAGQRGPGGRVGVGGAGGQCAGERVADGVERVDDRGVGGEDLRGGTGAGEGVVADPRDAGQRGAQVAGGGGEVRGALGVEGGGRPVGLGGLPVDLRLLVAGRGRRIAGGPRRRRRWPRRVRRRGRG